MKSAYLDYAMSVIVGRALPDGKDGLKPVHRRILYAMKELGLTHTRPFKKSATVVGNVLGKYHPHGDQAVYDALVRMVQDFSLRYPLIQGQGNFGSVDGDAAAAYRYTEAKLSRIAEEILADIEKETVDFVPNFDGSLREPLVLPSKFPNLIANGSSGIAVGMATNIPSHNLCEIVEGMVSLIDNPELSSEELLDSVLGPDFPTGGVIVGRSGLRDAYLSGRGRVVVRARAYFETTKSGRERIIVTEIPYQVNKSSLLESIASLVRERRIEGISDLRDESDREGMRICLELKRDAQKEIVLNQLFKHTQLRSVFGVILLVLVEGEPRVLKLKELLDLFLEHRHKVVLRRTEFEFKKAEERAHIVEGLRIALEHIDEVVELIRKSKTPEAAKKALMKKFKLSDRQSQAILDMRLARLTSLETGKLEEEYLELIKSIARLKEILGSREKVMGIIKEELLEMREKFGDPRRTEIVDEEEEELSIEDLIAEEDMVVTVTHRGYLKRLSIGSYRRQGRGGKGVTGMTTAEQDFAERIFVASTHDYMLFFTNRGRCYWLKVHEIPEGGRLSKGRSIANLLTLGKGERVSGVVPVRSFDEGLFLVMVTRGGVVKKTALSQFRHPRRDGIIAATVHEEDELIEVEPTGGDHDVILISRNGKAIRFREKQIRPMGRAAAGVRGIRLSPDDRVVAMLGVRGGESILIVSEKGYGKRTPLDEYRVTGRGGKGIVTLKITEKNGRVVAAKAVVDQDELILIASSGQVIRMRARGISEMGRATQGVRLMNLAEGDSVVDVATIAAEE